MRSRHRRRWACGWGSLAQVSTSRCIWQSYFSQPSWQGWVGLSPFAGGNVAVVTPSGAPGDRAATGLCCWVLCQTGEQGSRVFAGGGGGSSRLQGG